MKHQKRTESMQIPLLNIEEGMGKKKKYHLSKDLNKTTYQEMTEREQKAMEFEKAHKFVNFLFNNLAYQLLQRGCNGS